MLVGEFFVWDKSAVKEVSVVSGYVHHRIALWRGLLEEGTALHVRCQPRVMCTDKCTVPIVPPPSANAQLQKDNEKNHELIIDLTQLAKVRFEKISVLEDELEALRAAEGEFSQGEMEALRAQLAETETALEEEREGAMQRESELQAYLAQQEERQDDSGKANRLLSEEISALRMAREGDLRKWEEKLRSREEV